MSIDTIKVPATLESVTVDGKLAKSNQIFDESTGMFQSNINQVFDSSIKSVISQIKNGASGVNNQTESSVVYSFDKSVFRQGYCNLSKTYASSAPAISGDLYSFYCQVLKGDVVTITTHGGNDGRAYAISDESYKIVEVSNNGAKLQEKEVTVSQNGYLFVNCHMNTCDPIVTIKHTLEGCVDYLLSRTNEAPCMYNPKLPVGKEVLKVLLVGNSFIQNSTTYVNGLIRGANLSSNVAMYRYNHGASGIDVFLNDYKSDNVYTLEYCGGSVAMETTGTLRDLIAQDWDVIIFTQYSREAGDYGKLNPYIHDFINMLRIECPNQNVVIGYQMPWSHTVEANEYELRDLIGLTKTLCSKYGVDLIIPCGIAVQNARNSSLSDEQYLTSDNWHLNERGKYVAACCVFQSLIAPVFNISVVGNTYTINSVDGVSSLAQRCAFFACTNRWTVTTDIDETQIDPSKVNPKSISIDISDTVIQPTTATIVYTPNNTYDGYKGVTWEVTSGKAYASIDASSGLVTPYKDGTATIKATSTYKKSLTSEKQITIAIDSGSDEPQQTTYVEFTLNEGYQGFTPNTGDDKWMNAEFTCEYGKTYFAEIDGVTNLKVKVAAYGNNWNNSNSDVVSDGYTVQYVSLTKCVFNFKIDTKYYDFGVVSQEQLQTLKIYVR